MTRTHGRSYNIPLGDLNDPVRAGHAPSLSVQASREDGWIVSIVGPAGRWKMPAATANDLAHALLAAVGDCVNFELEERTAGEAGESPS